MRVAGGIVWLLCVLAGTACDGGSPPSPVHSQSPLQAEPVAWETLGFPDAIAPITALKLPAGVRSWGYGAHAGERFLTFGVVPAGVGLNSGPPADRLGAYAVLDVRTRDLQTYPTIHRGADTRIAVILVTGDTEHLVRVETWPAPDPTQACPDNPASCTSWAVYARRLPAGAEVEVDASRQPGPPQLSPQPAVTSDAVLWQSVQRDRSEIIRWRPGQAVEALGGTTLPPGNLTVAADAWIGTPPRFDDLLVKIPLDGSAPSRSDLPTGSSDAAVRGSRLAYRQELADGESVELMLADVGKPGKAVAIHGVSDIYRLCWASDDTVAFGTPEGPRLVRTDRTWTPLPGTDMDRVHCNRDRLTFLRDINGAQVLAVGRVAAKRG
jgi:hypothetical protein